MLVVPSPKFQLHDVGLPVDESVNWIVWPTDGAEGVKVKEEESTDMEATVTVLLPCLAPKLVVATKLTT